MPQAVFAGSRGKMARSLRAFRDDERGAMAFFMIILFLMMIMFGGIAVDVMRFEWRRVALQQTMDRVALAAASLTQTRTPNAIATEWFDKVGLDDEAMVDFGAPAVTALSDAGLRRVTITSKVRSENFFMTIFSDREYLEGPAVTQAAQGVSQIEVMLVLDITGSMNDPAAAGDPKTKIQALRESAAQFVSIVKGNDSKNGVSIGLVPYASQVNLPVDLRQQFNETHVSSWDGVANAGVPFINCLEVPTSSFTTMALSTATAMPMASIADFNSITTSTNYLPNTDFPVSTTFGRAVCGTTPDDPNTPTTNEALNNHVTLPTKNGATIEGKIARLTAGGNTSIALGMRWGAALMDQAARPIYNALVVPGEAGMAGRPADNASLQTRKIIILMTDGEHVANNHINDTFKVGPSPIYRGADGRFAMRFNASSATALNRNNRPPCAGSREYFIPHLKPNSDTSCSSSTSAGRVAWVSTPSWSGSGTVTQLDWSEVWRYMRFDYMVRQIYMRSNVTNITAYSTIANVFRKQYISAANLNTLLQQNCAAAKNAGVEIYGIAFAAPTNGQTQISNCSSDPKVNYYYNAADNGKLTAAFNQIAVDISELRLTQ